MMMLLSSKFSLNICLNSASLMEPRRSTISGMTFLLKWTLRSTRSTTKTKTLVWAITLCRHGLKLSTRDSSDTLELRPKSNQTLSLWTLFILNLRIGERRVQLTVSKTKDIVDLAGLSLQPPLSRALTLLNLGSSFLFLSKS